MLKSNYWQLRHSLILKGKDMYTMKTALVLEGGAMRGIYTCGVLDAFIDKKIDFDYVIGVSAGAAFGSSYISKQRGRNLEIYERFVNDKRYVSYENLLKEGSLFGLKFVYEDIPRIHVPFDFDAYYKSPCKFYSVVTNIETGKPEYFDKTPEDKNFDIFKASCALPMFSPVIKIKDGYYLDGGITDPIPFEKPLADGYDKLVVVLTQDKTYRKKKQSFLSAIKLKYRKYPKIYEVMSARHKVYNAQLDKLDKLEKEGKALIIRPDKPVEFKRIETDLTKLKKLYHTGEYDGFVMEEKIKEFIKNA